MSSRPSWARAPAILSPKSQRPARAWLTLAREYAHKSWRVASLLAPYRRFVQAKRAQSDGAGHSLDVSARVGESHRSAEPKSVAFKRLEGEGEQAARSKSHRDCSEDWIEVADIDEGIGRDE